MVCCDGPFIEEKGVRKVLTVYWTSKIDKYLAGETLMEMRYDAEADILPLILRKDPPVDAIEEPGGVIVSYSEDGQPVSVEFLNAAARRLIVPGEASIEIHS